MGFSPVCCLCNHGIPLQGAGGEEVENSTSAGGSGQTPLVWALLLAKPRYRGFESLAITTAVLATLSPKHGSLARLLETRWLSRRDGRYKGPDYVFYLLRLLDASTNFMDEHRAAPPIGDTLLLQYANTYRPRIRYPFRVV